MKHAGAALSLWILISLGQGITSLSQTPFWQQINRPYGGNASCIVFDSVGGTLIAGGTGLYLSTDQGLSWLKPEGFHRDDSVDIDPSRVSVYDMVMKPDGEI